MRYYGLNKTQTIESLNKIKKLETPPQYTVLEVEHSETNRKFVTSLSVQDILTLFSVGEWMEGVFQDKSRIRDISDVINNKEGKVLINPMITVALWRDKASFYNITPSQIADSTSLSNPISILKIDWTAYYQSLIDLPEKKGFFANARARLGLVLDGYQRLFAAAGSGKMDYCFPVNIIIMDFRSTEKVYKRIKQSENEAAQFNYAHREDILQMYDPDIFQMVGFSEPKVEAILLTKELNEESFLFAGRIQMGDTSWESKPGGKRPVAKQSSMEKLLTDWISALHNIELVYPEIHVSSISEEVNLLDNYFGAWQQCWPDAWLEGTKKPPYMLCKTTGIALLFKLFTPVTMNVLKANKDLSMENYVEVLKKAYFEPDGKTPITLHFPGKGVPLNWESKNFSEFSSGAGRNKLCRQLELYLY